ncbi:hypothetical protein AB833_15575 [Chromatiales bacterium (ex Bugula neritina AB1)]|nr:hypothetical protein AB833_15575 [Chromatiales bacterium (ex Bugula neritina AB1)]
MQAHLNGFWASRPRKASTVCCRGFFHVVTGNWGADTPAAGQFLHKFYKEETSTSVVSSGVAIHTEEGGIMPLPRNPVIRTGAILRKGGAHTKSVSGQRQLGKRGLLDEIDDWFDDRDEDNDSSLAKKTEGGKMPPAAFLFNSPRRVSIRHLHAS